MKKITAFFLVIALVMGISVSCGKPQDTETTASSQATSSAAGGSETTGTAAATSAAETTAPSQTDPPVEYEYPAEDGLIVYLAFDAIENGTVKDVTGNGHDAILSGSPTLTENGRVYNGLSFSGTGQSLMIPDSAELNFTADDSFTAEIYYKWKGLTSGSNWPCLFQKGLSASENAYRYFGLWINSSDKVLNLGITGNGGTGTNNLTSYLPTDTGWHQAVIIQNAEQGTISLYIDGILRCSGEAIDASSEGQNLYLGFNGTDGQFLGTLDEFKLYDYAKDPSSYEKKVTGVDSMQADSITYTDEESGETITLPYRVYYPTDYDPDSEKTYPMLFFLHGFGECGTDNVKQLRILNAPNELLDDIIDRDDCIIVAPQCEANPASHNWVPINQQWTIGSRELTEKPTISLAAATELLYKFLDSGKVDQDRVYAAGVSMGGYGTWELIARNPEVFAAAIPVCGAGIPSMAEELVDIAIWAFHGEADTTVPVSGTRDMEEAIKAAGGTKIQATYFPGVGHNSWIPAFATEGLLDWLFAQSKSNS